MEFSTNQLATKNKKEINKGGNSLEKDGVMCGQLQVLNDLQLLEQAILDPIDYDQSSLAHIEPRQDGRAFPGDAISALSWQKAKDEAQNKPQNHGQDQFKLQAMHWGLVPNWIQLSSRSTVISHSCTDQKTELQSYIEAPNIRKARLEKGSHLARLETAAYKPYFKEAYHHQRCVVPIAGFYEWSSKERKKVPYLLKLSTRPVLFIAGIYSCHRDLQMPSLAILTQQATDHLAHIHHRMPVILDAPQIIPWLRNRQVPDQLDAMMDHLDFGVAEFFNSSAQIKNNHQTDLFH